MPRKTKAPRLPDAARQIHRDIAKRFGRRAADDALFLREVALRDTGGDIEYSKGSRAYIRTLKKHIRRLGAALVSVRELRAMYYSSRDQRVPRKPSLTDRLIQKSMYWCRSQIGKTEARLKAARGRGAKPQTRRFAAFDLLVESFQMWFGKGWKTKLAAFLGLKNSVNVPVDEVVTFLKRRQAPKVRQILAGPPSLKPWLDVLDTETIGNEEAETYKRHRDAVRELAKKHGEDAVVNALHARAGGRKKTKQLRSWLVSLKRIKSGKGRALTRHARVKARLLKRIGRLQGHVKEGTKKS